MIFQHSHGPARIIIIILPLFGLLQTVLGFLSAVMDRPRDCKCFWPCVHHLILFMFNDGQIYLQLMGGT